MKCEAICVSVLLAIGQLSSLAQNNVSPSSDAELEGRLAQWFQEHFDNHDRSMWREPNQRSAHDNGLPRRLDSDDNRFVVDGWSAFPTELWEYAADDSTQKRPKLAQVVLLNPTSTQVAKWVATTCRRLKENADDYPEPIETYAELLVGQIWDASNAQFPVAGIVYENLDHPDNINEIYCFRDGVTVGLAGITDDPKHRSKYIDPPTAQQVQSALHPDDAKITWIGMKARIQSTDRQDYPEGGDFGTDFPKTAVNLPWVATSKKCYQDAWNSADGQNELMFAWARSSFKDRQIVQSLKAEFKTCKWKGIWHNYLGGD
jgi:hypothetical protein